MAKTKELNVTICGVGGQGVVLLSELLGNAAVRDGIEVKAILPRRFQIFEDRLRILLGGPFAINIPFANIAEAKPASGRKATIYSGLRLATSSYHVVEIIRKKGLNLVISPAHDDMFLEQLNQARKLQSA